MGEFGKYVAADLTSSIEPPPTIVELSESEPIPEDVARDMLSRGMKYTADRERAEKTQRRPCSSSIPVAVSPIAAMLERFLLFLVLQYAVVSPRSVSSVFHVGRKRFVHAKCVSARRAP